MKHKRGTWRPHRLPQPEGSSLLLDLLIRYPLIGVILMALLILIVTMPWWETRRLWPEWVCC